MIIAEPTTEEREQLKRTEAHRFPELKYFPKPGDDGKEVRLPVVLGNPTGACKMPKGARISKAWDDKVAETFGASKPDMSALVSDCILWPPPPLWATWLQRWPALEDSLSSAVIKKYGGSSDQISEPGTAEVTPEAIAAARASAPGATWKRFASKGTQIDLLIKAPSSTQWAMFTDAMKRPENDHWALALELATACTVASTTTIADAFARWPGLVLWVDREASWLAGMSSKFEEGEL